MDIIFPTFAADARNIRFGLSTDGMNHFCEQSSGHSTWPMTLYIQPSSAVYEAEVHYDAGAYLRPETT